MADVTARTLRPSSAPVHGTLFLPTAVEPVAAVLVIGGSGGSEPSYVGQALATKGIAALSVAYFGREGLPAQLRSIRLEYFFSALETLRSELPSPATPIALLGMSRGSGRRPDIPGPCGRAGHRARAGAVTALGPWWPTATPGPPRRLSAGPGRESARPG